MSNQHMQAMHTQMAMLSAKNTSLEIEKNRLQTQLYQQQRLHLQGSFPCGNGKMQTLYGNSDFQKDAKIKELQEKNEELQKELKSNRFWMDQLKEIINELRNQNQDLLNTKEYLLEDNTKKANQYLTAIQKSNEEKQELKTQVEQLHIENDKLKKTLHNKRQRKNAKKEAENEAKNDTAYAGYEEGMSKKLSKQLSLK